MYVYDFCRKYGYDIPKHVSSYGHIIIEVFDRGQMWLHKGKHIKLVFTAECDANFVKKYLKATVFYDDINAGEFTFNDFDELDKIVKEIEKGKVQCAVCGKMIDIKDSEFCIFAGRRCKTCDDPNLDIALD